MNYIAVTPDTSLSEIDWTKYPLLSQIESPADMRSLPVKSLISLCDELRDFLVESLSCNPGHFASSMGAVELTVAIHYVFNTPYDRIVWDVGHQAYGHKLLTGRAKRFHTNRKLGGLSGFPNPEESEFDTFAAGHASNSISAALGMAVATKLKNESPRRNVVAVIGDASISGGLAFEGLNNAANSDNNLLIILNDNDMSIDRPVGSLNGYLAHLTTSKGYNTLRYNAYQALKHMRIVNEKNRGRILRFNNSLKSLIAKEQNIFEGLNIRYFGPFDGHDLPRLISVLNDIKDMEGPRILHLCTVKGKGYPAAEANPAVWHAPGKFDPESGKIISTSPKYCSEPKYQDVFGEVITRLAESNPQIVGVTAAMPSGTSMIMMQKRFPDRTFDVGISEGHAVTFAGGLAKDGLLPYVAIYSSFLQRAYDQIIHDVALQSLPVVFCIDRAGLVGEDGATHHGVFDLSYLSDIPGMVICAPSDEQQLANLLYTSQLPGRNYPMAIRYPRGKGIGADYNAPFEAMPVGKGIKLRDGNQVAVLSIGTCKKEVLVAADKAREDGISVAVYDMVFLKPIDETILKEVVGKNVPIITVEDASRKGGLGSAVLEWLSDNNFSNKVTRIGIPDKFVPQGTVAQLKKLCGLDAESILGAINKAVEP